MIGDSPVSSSHRHHRDHAHDPPAGPERLRGRGRRLTQQRTLIWEALAARPDAHLSADEVLSQVQRRLPHVNPSTVYRTLDLLVEEGLVRRSDLGAGRSFYEPAHEHSHHHLVCERCGRVAHVHDDALGTLRDAVERESGFRVGDGELALFGLCADCRRR